MTKYPKYTKEEKQEIRQKAKKDPIGFWITPTIQYWKERPLKAIWTFTSWALIFYLTFTILQAINYDTIYCTSNLPQYNGKILETYNQFIEHTNNKIETYNKQQQINPLQKTDKEYLNMLEEDTINCGYNLTKWRKDEKHILQNIKILAIDRWHKNTN